MAEAPPAVGVGVTLQDNSNDAHWIGFFHPATECSVRQLLPGGLRLKRCRHRLHGPVFGHCCAGDDQDVAIWLQVTSDAADSHPVVLNAEGQRWDEGQAQPGGHESLGRPVLVRLNSSTRKEAGALVCVVGCGAAATYFTSDVDP